MLGNKIMLLTCLRLLDTIITLDLAFALGGGIAIVGLPGGQVQSLPEMYVGSIRRWIELIDDDDGMRGEGGDVGGDRRTGMIEMVAIPGSGGVIEEEEEGDGMPRGWVNPTSTSELWWPLDLPTLQVRPALSVLFRSGVLSYVSAGLDVRVPHHRRRLADDAVRGEIGIDDVEVAPSTFLSKSWRNHGLNSQPIARQWTTLEIAMERMFHVEGFVVPISSHPDEEEEEEEEDNDIEYDDKRRRTRRRANRRYKTLFPSLDARHAMDRVATFVAEMDSSSPLAEGFHIASFPMTRDWIDLPKYYGGGMRRGRDGKDDCDDDDDDDDDNDGTIGSSFGEGTSYKIVCLATSKPFASKLLDIDDGILAKSSTSVLEIDVSRTAEGGKSMCLPKVYRELYLNNGK